ncbi:MAG: DUF4175 domain-containing protein [Saprospiraceae bacterium]|nr:DUF4175 domain-containing protein [Saprospiraceae bacterium]
MNIYKSNYEQLIEKLDQFIRKYYLNKCIKGSLYTIAAVLILFLSFNLLEYYFYFGTGVRKVFFYSFIFASLFALGYWVLNPLFRYFKLGDTITHEDAAKIIGDHFENVQDKLLNILQLKKQESTAANRQLLEASIDQKTQAISLVPFKSAINFQNNRRYLKYALPPLLLLLFILLGAPSILREGTSRIINNNVEFEKAAPFSFDIENEKLSVVQFDDYTLNIAVAGEIIPNEVFVQIEDFLYKMEKLDKTHFSYTFRNVQKDTPFRLTSSGVLSKEQKLEVLTKPSISNFSVFLEFPSYVKRENETLDNIGDLVIPEGTKVTWAFDATGTDNICFLFGSETAQTNQKSPTSYQYSRKIFDDVTYKLFLTSKKVPVQDSLMYSVNVVKDQYPVISAEKITDSLDNQLVYFIGKASDDYGLNTLAFHYTITPQNGKSKGLQSQKLPKDTGREIQFSHIFDIRKLGLNPGDQLSFYFEVIDNDAIHGGKSAKSSVMQYSKPTVEEIKKQEEENDEEVKDELKNALKSIEKLQENFQKMRDKLLQQKQLEWQDKKQMEKLLEEQKKLQENIKKAKEKLDENIKNQEEFNKQPEDIKEEQQKLQELMEKAMDPEAEELMEKIMELMQELDKEDAVQMIDQFKMENEALEKKMDRLLNLYKELEVEKMVKDQIEELNKLAEKQDALSDKTEKKEGNQEALKKEQEELNNKFEELQKKMEELEKKNEELERPKDLGEKNEEEMDDIQEDMEDSQDKLDKKDNAGASKSQKNASKKMKNKASKMQESMDGASSDQAQEDVKTLRQLLENLVKLSFDQEDLSKFIEKSVINTPPYVKSIQKQFKLKNDFQIIEDTLVALSNRNSDIEGFVMDKVSEIKFNFKESLKLLEERSLAQGVEKQRRVMKNLNDLALMLSESLENAQQQAAQGMPGAQQCSKPGNAKGKKAGKKPMDKISQGQQGLGDQVQKMKDKLKEGKDGKDGNSSKDYAEAAAKQAALRKALQEMQKEKQEQGKGSKELEELINNMDKIETDLVNKRLNYETLKRLKDIETRLLEAEKAEQQREQDEKRKSETALDKRREIPQSIQEYLKKRQAETEMYKTVSPSLKPYYRTMVDQYYQSLKKSE